MQKTYLYLMVCVIGAVSYTHLDVYKRQRIIADHATYDELSKTVTDILGPAPQMSMANGNYVLCDKRCV